MEFKAPSRKELNALSKEMLISLYLQIASSYQLLTEQNQQIIAQNEKNMKQIENLQEQLSIMINHRFGRKTEKTSDIIEGQLIMNPKGEILEFNEIEVLAEQETDKEKTDEELLEEAKRREARKRKKGVRQEDIRFAKVEVVEYKIPEDELKDRFPEGWKELGYKTSYRAEYKPAELIVYEEHIHKYKSAAKNVFVYADHPKHLLPHGMITPSLAAKIIFDKYINAIPINRISKELGWLDMVARPPTMSRWMINLTDKYLIPLQTRMKHAMMKAKLIHCDETPFICEQDRKKEGRTKNSKSFMWVYHTADQYGSPPIFIYDYKDNRRTENVEGFLKGYHGIIMADGYEPYHTVAKKSNGDIVVAGCYAHAKRKFAEIIKADPKNSVGTVAYEGNQKISKIYYVDNKMKKASPEERLRYRQEKVAPLVDDLFKWAKDKVGFVATEQTRKALTYLINQEPYLRAFLNDGMIPLDNSDAERSIRSFCLGKHSWHVIASSNGASSSGILYSIAETAKANGLKPYEYFKYLFEQLLESENNITDDFIDTLLPWSDKLPEELKNKT